MKKAFNKIAKVALTATFIFSLLALCGETENITDQIVLDAILLTLMGGSAYLLEKFFLQHENNL